MYVYIYIYIYIVELYHCLPFPFFSAGLDERLNYTPGGGLHSGEGETSSACLKRTGQGMRAFRAPRCSSK